MVFIPGDRFSFRSKGISEAFCSLEIIPAWNKNFFEVDQGTLFELILAANYLDMKGQLNYECKTVASMIVGKTPDQIRTTFNIPDDNPKEAEALAAAN